MKVGVSLLNFGPGVSPETLAGWTRQAARGFHLVMLSDHVAVTPPRLRRAAEDAGLLAPDLCPRIRLHVTPSRFGDDKRLVGEGTLEQVRADLAGLESLGARYVLLDTYLGDPEATRDHEPAWRTLAERVLDIAHESLR